MKYEPTPPPENALFGEWGIYYRELAEYRGARIEALERELAGVREGTHVIVPVEPTEEMARAAFFEWDEDQTTVTNCKAIYRAMLAASQLPTDTERKP